ncbi:MAG TPA: sodium:proton antiporter [Rhizomicrobium sp.]
MILTTPADPASSFALAASTAILVGAFALISLERVERAVVALLGAVLVVILGLLDQVQAIAAIDFNTLGLLAGMMIIVSVSRKSGVFGYAAIRATQFVRANPAGVLAVFALITAVLSAFVNNVTVVLLVVPVTFVICDELKIGAYPFLFAEILASNIGGTATLIGDPPNILIGSATGYDFNAFASNLAPLVALLLLAQIAIGHAIWGRQMRAAADDRARVMAIRAAEAIEDRYLLVCSLGVITAVIAALAAAPYLHLEPATVALCGAGVLLLLESLPSDRTARGENLARALADVEWTMLIFLAGLFVMIGAVEKTGLLAMIGRALVSASGHDAKVATGFVLWISAVLSAFVDNVPYVAAMIPLVKDAGAQLGGAHSLAPLWWSLALGAGLGGNGTLIGASTNLTVAALAERSGIRFGFVSYAIRAMPPMLASVAIAQVYLLWRYY